MTRAHATKATHAHTRTLTEEPEVDAETLLRAAMEYGLLALLGLTMFIGALLWGGAESSQGTYQDAPPPPLSWGREPG